MENFGFSIAIAIVIMVVVLQFISFVKTKQKITELGSLFKNVDSLFLKKTSISSKDLQTESSLRNFLSNIPEQHSTSEEENNDEDYTDVSLLATPADNPVGKYFGIIINRTNEYLCKNTGTSADLSILEDICDNQKDALDDEIHNSLNVPLYLGLAGTFIGIITGVSGIDFKTFFNTANDFTGLQHLLHGVVFAMSASLLGLLLSVWNGAISYKSAAVKSNDGKEEYMNFLRRELMPLLSNSMASSLNSLKGVLGHFVDKFGKNLNAYADSAELLNDNLEKQHLVLAEINKLSLTQTANKIANTFMQLKESADSLNVFHTYQEQLNSTISNVSSIINQIQDIMYNFKEFSAGLSVVVSNQNKTTELQCEFQRAIAMHFPTGSEARDAWRKEFDLLQSEGKQVSQKLSEQLTASTEHIQNFVTNNKEFFDTFSQLKEIVNTMVQYTNIQAECYKDMREEILNLRKDYKDAQIENIDLNKSIIKAIETKIVFINR